MNNIKAEDIKKEVQNYLLNMRNNVYDIVSTITNDEDEDEYYESLALMIDDAYDLIKNRELGYN